MSVRGGIAALGLAALLGAGVLAGCAGNLPEYPAMSDADALATIANRQALVTTISSECDLDLTDAQGQRVRLEGVLVAALPGNVRLRAWKFGQAVVDLTLADGKGWVYVPEDGPAAHRLDVDRVPVSQLSDALNLLGPEFFRTARASESEQGVLRVHGHAFGRDDVVCEIERRTLTPRRFIVGSEGTAEAGELLLDEYQLAGDLVWPMRLRLRSSTGEVLVRMREPELNVEHPPEAFTPPGRARALP